MDGWVEACLLQVTGRNGQRRENKGFGRRRSVSFFLFGLVRSAGKGGDGASSAASNPSPT